MNVFKFPGKDEWPALLQRPVWEQAALEKTVKKIAGKVRKGGDKSLRKYAHEFDGVKLKKIGVTAEEKLQAAARVPGELKSAIALAAKNIETFHRSQLYEEQRVETMKGVQCWRRSVAVEKVGLYIPGGTAPLFSTVLMLGIPARIAGCREIVLCTPPQRNGDVNPIVLYAAGVAGVDLIFKAGGAQAIAAMAYGTESIPKVDKIFGPGNQYVTCAKQMLQAEGIAIDMPAGPSEVCVLADANANASFIAADLLSQAEHGKDSQVMLVTTSEELVQKVLGELEAQLDELPRKKIAAAALGNSKIVVLSYIDEAVELVNQYAAEHLIIVCENDQEIADRIVNAGSVFLGHFSPESVGDYASGTNHTLPTNGYARSYSGVSVDSFVKKITYQKLSAEGLKELGPAVALMAGAEGLQAHANAVNIRMGEISGVY
jgi:histidinol dehydrogenase